MKTLVLADISVAEAAREAAAVFAAGGLVIYPTETVYGVGVDAMNAAAVEKLLAYKARREGKPLSIAVTDQAMAEQYVELTKQAKKFYERFLPGPYTIVSKGKGKVAPGVESEFGTLGVRIPDFPLVGAMVKALGLPITATSANASGEKRPYTVADVLERLNDKQKSLIDLIIDAGTLPPNEPSTVIDTTLATPLTVRGTQTSGDQVFETNSPQETQDLAGKLMLKHWETIKSAGLLVGLNGELGAGKTVFTAGIAKFLKLATDLPSPTYTYIHEYDYNRHSVEGTLCHLDVWKVDNQEMFERLEVAKLLVPGNVVVVEWWQQVVAFWNKKPDVSVYFEDTGEHSRRLTIQENS